MDMMAFKQHLRTRCHPRPADHRHEITRQHTTIMVLEATVIKPQTGAMAMRGHMEIEVSQVSHEVGVYDLRECAPEYDPQVADPHQLGNTMSTNVVVRPSDGTEGREGRMGTTRIRSPGLRDGLVNKPYDQSNRRLLICKDLSSENCAGPAS